MHIYLHEANPKTEAYLPALDSMAYCFPQVPGRSSVERTSRIRKTRLAQVLKDCALLGSREEHTVCVFLGEREL